jgi:hypothetical protein
MTEPVPILTVGDLKSELRRWLDDKPVTFYSPLKAQEFRFYCYRPGDSVLVLDLPIVLIVEDDHLIQSVVEEALTEGGFEIVIASSGEQAIELLDSADVKCRA